jgi:hypothetical protein
VTNTIEILYFNGCPHWEAAQQKAMDAAAECGTGREVVVELVQIDSEEDAVRQRFIGSPTIRIDGVDVDASAEERSDYGLQCRLYHVGGRLEGTPPLSWIVNTLKGGHSLPAARLPADPTDCCRTRS